MKQYFEEVKQHHPQLAKALGITEGMDYEQWREACQRKMLQRICEPRPIKWSEPKEDSMRFYRYAPGTYTMIPTTTKE